MSSGVWLSSEGRGTALIRRPVDDVWAFVRPVESSLIIFPDVVSVFRVPGTPDGQGHRFGVVRREGTQNSTTISEVVAEEPGRSAVVVSLVPALGAMEGTELVLDARVRTETILTPHRAGTKLSLSIRVPTPSAFLSKPGRYDRYVRASAQWYVDRVRQLMHAGADRP